MRYLGLPLITRKLKISEYAPLMTKLTKCFHSWSVKIISFAGRLQLLKSVIFGIINIWVSAFALPKGCVKNIESFCTRFLWSGNIDKKGIAKVSWTTVCLPKEEGGLGPAQHLRLEPGAMLEIHLDPAHKFHFSMG